MLRTTPSVRGLLGVLAALLGLAGCGRPAPSEEVPSMPATPAPASTPGSPLPAAQGAAPQAPVREALATFGGGCFWCTEAVYLRLEGVLGVTSGYSGGQVANPTYKQVCAGTTGHAEVIQVRYDPSRVAYETLLKVFFKTHDPTTLNRQGADVGTQYRSIILTHDAEQQAVAERVKQALDASGAFGAAIVTQIVPFERFYPAEEYHQDYFANNPEQGYCRAVVAPKVEKFERTFADLLKR